MLDVELAFALEDVVAAVWVDDLLADELALALDELDLTLDELDRALEGVTVTTVVCVESALLTELDLLVADVGLLLVELLLSEVELVLAVEGVEVTVWVDAGLLVLELDLVLEGVTVTIVVCVELTLLTELELLEAELALLDTELFLTVEDDVDGLLDELDFDDELLWGTLVVWDERGLLDDEVTLLEDDTAVTVTTVVCVEA